MDPSGVILIGHSERGSERIQAQKWVSWLCRNGHAKALTPMHVPESSSLAEAQERCRIYFSLHPENIQRWLMVGWSVHHMPAETGITYDPKSNSILQEGA